MKNSYFCNEGNHYVMGKEFYHQGKVCKDCRNEKRNTKIKNLKNVELAEYLLHRSCIRVLERVRDTKREAYIGVECDWTTPIHMKRDLMKDAEFWNKWIKQSIIYEMNNRLKGLRPTIDRIEADVKKGGHYSINNLQVLSHNENVAKAKSIECKVIFIKNKRVIKITNYQSINDVMKNLNIPGRNTINILRDTGEMKYIGNGYSVIIQTLEGMLAQNKPIYRAVVTKKRILVDYKTGKEVVISVGQQNFESFGVWFNES